jgi:hypothetical protein
MTARRRIKSVNKMVHRVLSPAVSFNLVSEIRGRDEGTHLDRRGE